MDIEKRFAEIDELFADNIDAAHIEKRFAVIDCAFFSIAEERKGVDKMLDFLCRKTERMDTMLDALIEQITLLRKKAALSEKKLQFMADKLDPTFYKVFPEMEAAERELDEALKRAVKAAGKKRPEGEG